MTIVTVCGQIVGGDIRCRKVTLPQLLAAWGPWTKAILDTFTTSKPIFYEDRFVWVTQMEQQ